MRRVVGQLLLLAAWLSVVTYGVAYGLPRWLQVVALVLLVAYVIGGSAYLLLRPKRDGRLRGGEIGAWPKSWKRWALDEPDDMAKKPL